MHKRFGVIVAAEAAAAAVVGAHGIGRRAAWLDEAYTWSTVHRPFPALVRLIVHYEGYQPLHSMLLWPVARLSTAVMVLRLPSLVAFVAAVPALALFARRLFGERTAIVAGALLALNGLALQYAQEARAYELAMLAATLAAAALARHVVAPSRFSRACWIAASAVTVYSHGMATLTVAAQCASLVALPAALRRERRLGGGVAWIALFGSVTALLPVAQLGVGQDYTWVSRPSFKSVRGLVGLYAGGSGAGALAYSTAIVVALVFAVRVLGRDRRSIESWGLLLTASWAALPPAVLVSVSFFHPIWLIRYGVPSLPPIAVLAAYGITRLRGRAVLAAAMAVLVAASAVGLQRWYGKGPYDRTREQTELLLARSRAGDALLFADDEVRIPFEYHARDDDRLAGLVPVFPPQPWGRFRTGDQRVVNFTRRDVAKVRAAGYTRVWVVVGYENSPADVHRMIALLARGYRITLHERWPPLLELYLLERA